MGERIEGYVGVRDKVRRNEDTANGESQTTQLGGGEGTVTESSKSR